MKGGGWEGKGGYRKEYRTEGTHARTKGKGNSPHQTYQRNRCWSAMQPGTKQREGNNRRTLHGRQKEDANTHAITHAITHATTNAITNANAITTDRKTQNSSHITLTDSHTTNLTVPVGLLRVPRSSGVGNAGGGRGGSVDVLATVAAIRVVGKLAAGSPGGGGRGVGCVPGQRRHTL